LAAVDVDMLLRLGDDPAIVHASRTDAFSRCPSMIQEAVL